MNDLDLNLQNTVAALKKSAYGTAMTGAGMSAESGIPTFRGPEGLWTKYGEPDDLGYEKFIMDPQKWWEARLNEDYMPEMKKALAEAKPNPGHKALTRLEKMGLIKHVITQNVDGLHGESGTTQISEMHGNNHLLRCIECEARFSYDDISFSILPPLCTSCGGYLKIDTVMFGEPIPKSTLENIKKEVGKTDLMLILGTSGLVQPAASLPIMAKSTNNAILIEINPERSALSDFCDIVINEQTGTILPRIVDLLAK